MGAHKLPNQTMPDNNLQRLVHKNVMATIHALVGVRLFQHIYVRDKRDGRQFDALDDGQGACAYVVSGVLALFGLIDRPHATVATTIDHMLQSGWVKTDTPHPGDVVQWPALHDNMHLAFYIGNNKVIGNSAKERVPAEYGITLGDGREPIAFYTHPAFRESL